jgi:hypothetical protein
MTTSLPNPRPQTDRRYGPPVPVELFLFWRSAFAIGIGIRIPTSFGTTVGH